MFAIRFPFASGVLVVNTPSWSDHSTFSSCKDCSASETKPTNSINSPTSNHSPEFGDTTSHSGSVLGPNISTDTDVSAVAPLESVTTTVRLWIPTSRNTVLDARPSPSIPHSVSTAPSTSDCIAKDNVVASSSASVISTEIGTPRFKKKASPSLGPRRSIVGDSFWFSTTTSSSPT